MREYRKNNRKKLNENSRICMMSKRILEKENKWILA
jgi:hypothetical protein